MNVEIKLLVLVVKFDFCFVGSFLDDINRKQIVNIKNKTKNLISFDEREFVLILNRSVLLLINTDATNIIIDILTVPNAHNSNSSREFTFSLNEGMYI